MTVWLTLAVLTLGGMGMTAWQATHQHASPEKLRWAVPLGLLTLALLLVFGPETVVDSGELAQDRLARAGAALLLCISAVTWTSEGGPRRIVALLGALMALCANSLLTLWVGLLLWIVAGSNKAHLAKHHAVGLGLSLVAVALVYAGAGVLHIDALGVWCATSVGSVRIDVYAGIALMVIAIGLICGLLGDTVPTQRSRLEQLYGPLSSLFLGTMLTLRIGLALPSLWWEWRWLLGILALCQGVIFLDHWLCLFPEERRDLSWLVPLQSSILLLSLVWSQSPLGLAANLGLVLNLALVAVGLRHHAAAQQRLVLVVLLMSLGGVPLTLGFQSRLLMVRSTGWSWADWRSWLYVALYAVPGSIYAWGSMVHKQVAPPSETSRNGWIPVAFALLVALAVVVLGIVAAPLLWITRWVLA